MHQQEGDRAEAAERAEAGRRAALPHHDPGHNRDVPRAAPHDPRRVPVMLRLGFDFRVARHVHIVASVPIGHGRRLIAHRRHFDPLGFRARPRDPAGRSPRRWVRKGSGTIVICFELHIVNIDGC